jgi:hypothetical protein
MLVLRNKGKSFEVEKKSVKTLLEGSSLESLSKTIDSTEITYVDIDEIFKYAKIEPKTFEDREIAWDVIVNLFDKKTVFHKSKLISTYDSVIDSVVNQVSPYDVVRKLMIDIIPNNTPEIIKKLRLDEIYAQLIFYEYVYMSQNISLVDKLRMMVVNKFNKLTKMIDEGVIEICTNSAEKSNSKYISESESTDDENENENDFISLRNKCYGSEMMIKIFDSFIENHSEWIGIDLKSCMPSEISAIILVDDLLCSESKSDLDKKHTDQKINQKYSQKNNQKHSQKNNQKINLIDICHINKLYQSQPEIVTKKLINLIPEIDFSVIHKFVVSGKSASTIDDAYSMMFESIDFIVRLLENDEKSVKYISKKDLTKIFIKWLQCNGGQIEQMKIRRRNLQLSDSIKNIMDGLNVTFSEISYVLSADRLDIFKSLTKTLGFRSINKVLYKYLSPKIITHVINTHLTNTMTKKINETLVLTINPFDLIERKPLEVSELLKMLNNVFSRPIMIEYDSVINKYKYTDNDYVLIYWEYVEMIKNNLELVETIVTILCSIDSQKQLEGGCLDIVLLKTAIDNVLTKNNAENENQNEIQNESVEKESVEKESVMNESVVNESVVNKDIVNESVVNESVVNKDIVNESIVNKDIVNEDKKMNNNNDVYSNDDNDTNSNDNSNRIKVLSEKLDSVIINDLLEKMFSREGPNIGEIINELKMFSVMDLSMLRRLKNINKSYQINQTIQ